MSCNNPVLFLSGVALPIIFPAIMSCIKFLCLRTCPSHLSSSVELFIEFNAGLHNQQVLATEDIGPRGNCNTRLQSRMVKLTEWQKLC